MRSPDGKYFNIGPRLTLAFLMLILFILGGNGLILWNFHVARLQTDRLTGSSQQLIAVLRLQQSLLTFHQRLNDLAQLRDPRRLASEAEPLRRMLSVEIQQTRKTLEDLPPQTPLDPSILPTLEATEITMLSQLVAITELSRSGDWDAVRGRLANENRPLELQTAALVRNIDAEVSQERKQALTTITELQFRIEAIVPATALCTFCIATFLGWRVSRRMVDLRLEERVIERTRLARELHDTLLQTIQVSKMVADEAMRDAPPDSRTRYTLQRLSEWLGRASEEGRAALNSLRTPTFPKDDLLQAIRSGTHDYVKEATLQASFTVSGRSRELHALMREEVYCIACEAVRNACMHSQATRLHVELLYNEGFTLHVSDDGCGIPTEFSESGRQGHFGLNGMKERAARIGGKLRVATAPGAGTQIILRIAHPSFIERAHRRDGAPSSPSS